MLSATMNATMTQQTPQPVILVTGAARRVGASIARTLHAAGGRLCLHYRNSADDARSLAAELNALRDARLSRPCVPDQ